MHKTILFLLLSLILCLNVSGCGNSSGNSSVIGGGGDGGDGGSKTFATLKWSTAMSGAANATFIISSPAIAPDGTIYVGSGNFLNAFKADGTLKWKYDTGGAIVASPAIGSDGTIYAASEDRQLYAITPAGTLKWVFPTRDGLFSSPAIASDGTIYICGRELDLTILCPTGNPVVQLSTFYAVNPNGTLKWRTTLSGDVKSSPAIASDGTIYIGSDGDIQADRLNPCDDKTFFPPSDADPSMPVNGHLYAFNPDGSLKWDFKALGAVSSSPAIASDGTIYVGSDYSSHAYGTSRDKLISVGSVTIGYFYAINPNGTMKWIADLYGNVRSSPSIGPDGTIYVGSIKNDVFALTPGGDIKWQYPTRDDVNSSPAVASDGTIYVGSDDNSLYILNPDGTAKARFIAGGKVNSSPSIASDRTVYFASSDNKLYAVVGTSGLAETSWPKFRRDLPNTGRH